jgi:hypothetical protein
MKNGFYWIHYLKINGHPVQNIKERESFLWKIHLDDKDPEKIQFGKFPS